MLTRNDARQSQRAPAEHFTGNVRIDPLFQAGAPGRAALNGTPVEWLEKVTDEQYQRGTER